MNDSAYRCIRNMPGTGWRRGAIVTANLARQMRWTLGAHFDRYFRPIA